MFCSIQQSALPPLSLPLQNAIFELGSGPVEKVILRFNETLPFGDTRPFVFYVAAEEGEFPAIVNMANITSGKEQILEFFVLAHVLLLQIGKEKMGWCVMFGQS